MSEFSANSLWSKLAFLLTHVGYAGLLFGFLWGGWSGLDFCGTRNNCDVEVVEFLFVVGYICALVAVVLIQCLGLLDEVRGNKGAIISFIVFVLVAGFCVIVGDAYFISFFDGWTYGNTDTMCTGVLFILAGIFAILDMCGCKSN